MVRKLVTCYYIYMVLTDPLKPLTMYKVGFVFTLIVISLFVMKYMGIGFEKTIGENSGLDLVFILIGYVFFFLLTASYIFALLRETSKETRSASDLIFLYLSIAVVLFGAVFVAVWYK